VAVRGLYVYVEGVRGRYVLECAGGGWVVQQPPCSYHHYLGELPSRDVGSRSEVWTVLAVTWLSKRATTWVPCDDVVQDSRLHSVEEGVGTGYIGEGVVRSGGCNYGDTKAQHHDLYHLCSSGRVVRTEGTIGIPSDHPMAREVEHGSVEEVWWVHV